MVSNVAGVAGAEAEDQGRTESLPEVVAVSVEAEVVVAYLSSATGSLPVANVYK